MKEKVKIKIIKATVTSALWYRDMIGKELIVIDEGKTKDYYIAMSKRNREKIIYKEDAKIL